MNRFLPLFFFIFLLSLYLFWLIIGGSNENRSPLIGKSIPEYDIEFVKSNNKSLYDLMNEPGFKIINFWASWCNPCLMIAPHLEAISDEMKEVVVAKHNIDEEPNTPTKFGVRGIPTMLLFKDGELASTKVGATTKSNIQDWIKENL